jgi:hypothetical protein
MYGYTGDSGTWRKIKKIDVLGLKIANLYFIALSPTPQFLFTKQKQLLNRVKIKTNKQTSKAFRVNEEAI